MSQAYICNRHTAISTFFESKRQQNSFWFQSTQQYITLFYRDILLCWLKPENILLSCDLITQRDVFYKKN